MLQGLGDTYAKTLNLAGGATAQKLIELFLFEFTFTSESEQLEALGYVRGVRRSKSSAEATVTDTLTLSTQYADWAQLGFALDEFPKSATNVIIPTLKTATVPAAPGPYEIADAAITTANDSFIFVYVNAFGSWGQPGSLVRTANSSTAPTTTKQVQVETTSNDLIFAAGLAGAPVSYTVPVEYSTIEAYGGTGATSSFGKIEFRGKLYSPESTDNWAIYFPSLSRNSRPNIELTGDVPTLSIDFAAETPSGWDKPYVIYNLDTGVLAP